MGRGSPGPGVDVTEAIASLEPGYDALLRTLTALVEPDPRVRALWLTGSVGRGVADAGSDLDVLVTVTSTEEFTDPAIWAPLDPVISTPIPGLPGCFAFTTRGGLRVDLVLETPADVATTHYRHRVRVFDRDGLVVPQPDDDGSGPDLEQMSAVLTEYFRHGAIFPAAVVAREDWLLGQVAVHNGARMLYELFVLSNAPLPPMGIKQWSSKLTADQRQVLAALEPPRATRDEVVSAMRAVRAAIETHGRAAVERSGGTWPAELEGMTTAYWRRHGLL